MLKVRHEGEELLLSCVCDVAAVLGTTLRQQCCAQIQQGCRSLKSQRMQEQH